METSRQDIERDKKQTYLPETSTLGFSSYKLRYGDLFLYKEHYTDGSHGYRQAKCHGRIRPNFKTSGRREWLILAQAANDMMSFTYERWIEPNDVIETCPKDRANAHILAFFEEQEKINK